jgi:hypothetical protein
MQYRKFLFFSKNFPALGRAEQRSAGEVPRASRP